MKPERVFKIWDTSEKKSFEFIKKLLLTKFPTYLFKYRDHQST